MNEDRAQELRKILADSGSVTFIKSGQALSLRGDLVKNREYVRELTKLQARVFFSILQVSPLFLKDSVVGIHAPRHSGGIVCLGLAVAAPRHPG